MIVIIDNYDSFTYNIVEFYRAKHLKVRVFRNDETSISEIESLSPDLIVLSPGPKDPRSAGITVEAVQYFAGKVPLFGICLGCQSMAHAYGARIVRAEKMYHGKTSKMTHDGQGVLKGVSSPMQQMRYHSLIIEEQSLSDDFEISARSEGGEVMAIRHKKYPMEGVQFHPESIASMEGEKILLNSLLLRENTPTSQAGKNAPLLDDASIDAELSEIGNTLLSKHNLSRTKAARLMGLFSEGLVAPERIAMLLTALRMKKETPEEIAGIADEARSRAVPLPINTDMDHVVDIVGTGGDGTHTFNISTAAAIVAAGGGAKVAKHGNRSVSSKSGSADVLEALGIDIMIDAQGMADMLARTGMCFMFAPLYHPSMKHVAPVRRAMKIRTVFNILGPLVNPANVPHIVLGVYSKELMPVIAHVLVELGIAHGLVLHSADGMDEISVEDITHVIEVKGKDITHFDMDAREYIMHHVTMTDDIRSMLYGGDSVHNATLIRSMCAQTLDTGVQHMMENIVALNAGVALYVSGVEKSIEGGVKLAYQSIHEGKALAVLDRMGNV